jgi:hypothetical protein
VKTGVNLRRPLRKASRTWGNPGEKINPSNGTIGVHLYIFNLEFFERRISRSWWIRSSWKRTPRQWLVPEKRIVVPRRLLSFNRQEEKIRTFNYQTW